MRVFPPDVAAHHLAAGWWDGTTWDSRARASAAGEPAKRALVDPANRSVLTGGPARSLSWADVDAAVDELAAVLLAHGVAAGDVVGVQLPNVVEAPLTFLAIARIGAILTPFPVQYREHELVALCARAGATAFVTAADVLGRANAAAVCAVRDAVPSLATVFAFGADPPAGAVALDHVAVGDEERTALARHLASHRPDPNDAITITWTSGTESRPKGVPRAHGDWSAVLGTVIESPGVTAADVLLCTFPLASAGGIGGMFGPWISTGCTLVLHHPFDLDLFCAQIAEHRVTYTVSPPAVLTRLLLAPDTLAAHDLGSLRAVGSGSAPLTTMLVEGWEARGVEIINFFGSNEGIPLVADRTSVPDPAQRGVLFPNVGPGGLPSRVRNYAQTRSRLVDLDTGLDVTEPGRPGELRLKGPTVFAGYLDGEGDPFDEQGYYRTGDLFEYATADRLLLRYVDRAKDLIIRGGMNISPAEVESLLQTHPKVAEVAAVAMADDVLGERVAVFVVPRAGATIELAELLDHLAAQRVAKFKWPERLEVVAELPRNASGKVLKRELRLALTRSGT